MESVPITFMMIERCMMDYMRGHHTYRYGTTVADFVSFSNAVSTYRSAHGNRRLVGETEGMVRAKRRAQILRAAAAPLVRDHETLHRPHDTPGGLATGASRYDREEGGGRDDLKKGQPWHVFYMHGLWNNTWIGLSIGVPVSCCMLKRCPSSCDMVLETAGSEPKSCTKPTE